MGLLKSMLGHCEAVAAGMRSSTNMAKVVRWFRVRSSLGRQQRNIDLGDLLEELIS